MRNSYFLILIMSVFSLPMHAHKLWVQGKVGKNGKLMADLIYSHHFPIPDTIPQERLSLLDPVRILGKDYEQVLQADAQRNYHYEGEMPAKGSYIVYANYKPTYWLETEDGKWLMHKTRKDVPQAKGCGLYRMQGKSFLLVNDKNSEWVTRPVGEGLEITPSISPSQITVGKRVAFQVTYNGKPLQTKVLGSIADYDTNEDTGAKAFYAETDEKGNFYFKPLVKGAWYLFAEFIEPHPDADCDKKHTNATLTFEVK